MLVHGRTQLLTFTFFKSLVIASLLCLTLSGCGISPLPSGHKRSHAPWDTFDHAKKAFDQVRVGKTTFRELKKLGFDPFTVPNVKRLTYLDIINFFMPTPSIRVNQLASGLRHCIHAKTRCYGIEAWPQVRNKKRYGNVALDLMNFHKNEEISGWDFRSIIVLVGDKVVFKIWSGTPQFLEYNDERNPLGPIQGAGDYFLP